MNNNRLALYIFREKDGVTRRYVTYYLEKLQEVARKVVFIASCNICADSQQRIKALGLEVIKSESHLSDFDAWQKALCQIGWENVLLYDELILCNNQCYGPIFSFTETFTRMEKEKNDFWSIFCHPQIKNGGDNGGRAYLKSSFMVFRRSAMLNNVFKAWATNQTQSLKEKGVVAEQEVAFSRLLQNEGKLVYASAYDRQKYDSLVPNMDAAIYCADYLLRDRIPLIQKNLFEDYQQNMLSICEGRIPRECMDYIKAYTNYPEALIYEDLLSRMKMSDIRDALHLNFILPSTGEVNLPSNLNIQDVALICYAYYPDLASNMCNYIAAMPREASIYIISPRQDTLDAYEEILNKLNFRHVHYVMKENRGRDIAALCITSKEIIEKHKYICYVHDKKTKQARQLTIRDFTAHLMHCCLYSKAYVKSVINVFENNSQIGLLVPPTPNYGGVCPLGAEMYGNEESVQTVHKMLGLTSPQDKASVAPFGTCFWIKRDAIKPLYNYNWRHSDFPQEPLAVDGTISHGIERILPSVAQTAGYCTAWCSPVDFASLYMSNNTIMLREFNRVLIEKHGLKTWFGMLHCIKQSEVNTDTLRTKYVKVAQKLQRKKAQYRLRNILTLGLTFRRNKQKLNQYKKSLGL